MHHFSIILPITSKVLYLSYYLNKLIMFSNLRYSKQKDKIEGMILFLFRSYIFCRVLVGSSFFLFLLTDEFCLSGLNEVKTVETDPHPLETCVT